MKLAARVADAHDCPMLGPGFAPHAGGPILPPACPTVLIGKLPAARVGDPALCVGAVDAIAMGASNVLIGGRPAARVADLTSHNGTVTAGCATVLIGGPGGTIGDPRTAARFFSGPQASKDTCALMSAQGIVQQRTGVRYTETQMKAIATGKGYLECNGTTSEGTVMSAAGVPATMRGHPSLEDIAAAVREGRAVIVGLDARALWAAVSPSPMGHAVRVTGVDVDGAGNVTGIHINDTGTGVANQTVPSATFVNALNGFGGGRMTTSDQPGGF